MKKITALFLALVLMLTALSVMASAVSAEEHNIMLSYMNKYDDRTFESIDNYPAPTLMVSPDEELAEAKESAVATVKKAAGNEATWTEGMQNEVELALFIISISYSKENLEEMLAVILNYIDNQHNRDAAVEEAKAILGNNPTEDELAIFDYFCDRIFYAYYEEIDEYKAEFAAMLEVPVLGGAKAKAILSFEEILDEEDDFSGEVYDISEATIAAILAAKTVEEVEAAKTKGLNLLEAHFITPACEEPVSGFCDVYNQFKAVPVLGSIFVMIHTIIHLVFNYVK